MFGLIAVLLTAGPNPYLAQARKHHDALEFKLCLQALEFAPRWDSTTQERAEVELYDGLCRFNLGETKQAELHFELALRIDPRVALPPMISPKIEASFEGVRRRMPPPPPPEDAPKVVSVTPPVSEPPRVLLPAAPPPAPKRYVLPLVLGATALVAAGVATGLGVHARAEERLANDARFQSDVLSHGAAANDAALGTNVTWGVAGALTLGGLVALTIEALR